MLEYCMDLQSGSYGHSSTSDTLAQSFPYYNMDTGKFVSGEGYYTKRDCYEGYLLLVTESGSGKLTWNNQICVLEKGSAVLIDCSTYPEYRTMPGNTWTFHYLHFKALSMDGYKKTFLSKLTPIQLRMPKLVWQMMNQLYYMSFQGELVSYATQSNIISNLLIEILYSLIESTSEPQIYRSDIEMLAKYIRDNCTKPLRMDDFSEFIHLSKSHLIRRFERQIGIPPYKYLHMCRIDKAITLLRTSDMSITEVAYLVGYNDPIVFTRHFKEFHKMTPSSYRKTLIALPHDVS